MARLKSAKIHILNFGGAHGHFLRYSLDRFSTHTPPITEYPFDSEGKSHKELNYSEQFLFQDIINDDKDLPFENEKLIFIDIEREALYFERVCMSRAWNKTDLFSEESIATFLTNRGSTFPEYCKSKDISLKQGYMYSFMDLEKTGAVVRNKKRLDIITSKNNNIFRYSIKNFYTIDAFKKSIIDIGKHFNITFNTEGLNDLYREFYASNEVLQTHNAVKEYMIGNTNVKLDIIQQAYVDAQQY